MPKNTSSSPRQGRLSTAQWDSAVELYELGHKHQRGLANQFGISLTAMHKGLKKRGAVKACRVEETLVELKQELARKQLVRQETERVAWERMEQRTAMIGALIEQLLEADRAGTLADLNSLLEEIQRAL